MRVLAKWANNLADWEEGRACSPSTGDMIADYENIIGKLAVDPSDEFYNRSCMGETLLELLEFLTECEHIQPHQPLMRFEVIQVGTAQLWTVLKWDENNMCVGGDHHWLNREVAFRALAAYQRLPELHGQPESEVIKYY